MKIHALYTYNELRNYTYIIEYNDSSCFVLDPWDDKQVNNSLKQMNLNLTTIINTHEHYDHTQGNEALVKNHNCEVWAHENGINKIPCLTRTLKAHEEINIDNVTIRVMDTPGHTYAHLCFLVIENNTQKAVFTGDTLFNAGVGNCSSGDPETLYHSISEQFHTLEDNVRVYPGHDYLENNLNFTLSLEPENNDAKKWLAKVENVDPGKNPLWTTIGDERTFNTFFRLKNKTIKSNLGITNNSDKEVFVALRERRNSW